MRYLLFFTGFVDFISLFYFTSVICRHYLEGILEVRQRHSPSEGTKARMRTQIERKSFYWSDGSALSIRNDAQKNQLQMVEGDDER